MTEAALRRGSQVREPGEPLCGGCSSRRVLMLRAVESLPDKLDKIRALRIPSVGAR